MEKTQYTLDEVRFTMRLTTDYIEYLDSQAKRYGMTRTGYIRHLITTDKVANASKN